MSKFSKYKKLAIGLLDEDVGEEAIKDIAQNVLDLHLQMDETQFNPDLMPDESDIPSGSDYYQMIKKLVVKALSEGSNEVSDIEITQDKE